MKFGGPVYDYLKFGATLYKCSVPGSPSLIRDKVLDENIINMHEMILASMISHVVNHHWSVDLVKGAHKYFKVLEPSWFCNYTI